MAGFPIIDQLISDSEYRWRGLLNHHRCAETLGNCLSIVRAYNQNCYRHYASRLSRERDQSNFNSCFAEIIVSAHLVTQVHSRLLKGVRWSEKEADAIAIHRDGSETFLEVFSVQPQLRFDGEAHEISTHSQDSPSSIRQKIIGKIKGQGQFQEGRRNVAVVELNHYMIAGPFTVQSSLSDGFRVAIERQSQKVIEEGYDWTKGGFLATNLGQRISGVIDFDLGYYAGRRHLRSGLASVRISARDLEVL